MKKLCVFLSLILVLSIVFSACGQGSIHPAETVVKETEPKVTEVQKIVLSRENIKQFLSIKTSSYVKNRTRYAKIEIYPIQPGEFSSTEVVLMVDPELGCFIERVEGAKYKEIKADFGNYYDFEFTLPADGKYEIDIEFEVLWDKEDPLSICSFSEVSGTFIPR